MAIENFTGYAANDDGGDLTITAPKIAIDTVAYGQGNSNVSKDFTAGYFGDWTILFSFEATAMANKSGFVVGCLTNVVDEWVTLWNANDDCVGLQVNKGSTGTLGCYLRDTNNQNTDTFTHAVGTQYWCRFTRVGTTATLYIYDDSGRTNLVGEIEIETEDVNYRYCLPYAAMDSAADTAVASGYIENLNLNLPIPPTESVVISRDIHLGGI